MVWKWIVLGILVVLCAVWEKQTFWLSALLSLVIVVAACFFGFATAESIATWLAITFWFGLCIHVARKKILPKGKFWDRIEGVAISVVSFITVPMTVSMYRAGASSKNELAFEIFSWAIPLVSSLFFLLLPMRLNKNSG